MEERDINRIAALVLIVLCVPPVAFVGGVAMAAVFDGMAALVEDAANGSTFNIAVAIVLAITVAIGITLLRVVLAMIVYLARIVDTGETP